MHGVSIVTQRLFSLFVWYKGEFDLSDLLLPAVGLHNVPGAQFTTLFIAEVALCVGKRENANCITFHNCSVMESICMHCEKIQLRVNCAVETGVAPAQT